MRDLDNAASPKKGTITGAARECAIKIRSGLSTTAEDVQEHLLCVVIRSGLSDEPRSIFAALSGVVRVLVAPGQYSNPSGTL
jgi:hypothetical protein